MKSRLVRRWLLVLSCMAFSLLAQAADSAIVTDACRAQMATLEQTIRSANYCEKAEDCAIGDYGCPFGCESLINRNEAAKLDAQLRPFYQGCSTCAYRCRAINPASAVICENKRCVRINN